MIGGQRVIYPNERVPGATNLCALAVMTKAPRAGQVKTRLSPPLSPAEAAAINSCFLRDLSSAIAEAGESARGIACYTPLGAEEAYHDLLPNSFQLIAQRNGDFGERLSGAVEDLLAVGFATVCLINSDSPTVPASSFREAVEILSRPNECVVLGPSDDGGYYLIGMKRLHRRLFEEIAWSTDQVLAQTFERASEVGLEVQILPAGYDIDDRNSLDRLCQELLGPNDLASSPAPATRAFLQQWVRKTALQ